jgi:hypothetical protein
MLVGIFTIRNWTKNMTYLSLSKTHILNMSKINKKTWVLIYHKTKLKGVWGKFSYLKRGFILYHAIWKTENSIS